jgi:tRNA-Thr(GGU) m(6)t(6)A37 methyltransferase TsaA
MPIQASGAIDVQGSIEIFPNFLAGLKDLEAFSHLILIYHLHLSRGFNLEVQPFLDDKTHGVFATRAPRRPNPLGLSVVRLEGIEQSQLRVVDVDMLDGTPLLDIKPYVPSFDIREGARSGWFTGKEGQEKRARSDRRFI